MASDPSCEHPPASGVEFLRQEGSALLARVQLSVYGLEPLQKAVHNFTDRCHVHLEQIDERTVLCRFSMKSAGSDLKMLAGEFLNELLDQSLRARLAEKTEPVRRLLLAQAFSKTNLLTPEFDAADPRADPAGIARPDCKRSVD